MIETANAILAAARIETGAQKLELLTYHNTLRAIINREIFEDIAYIENINRMMRDRV